MASWGRCDYRQLQRLREKLGKLQSADMEKFCYDASRELAARLLALVIPRTPVGDYPKSSGKKGGTLRRGWTGKQSGSSGTAYAQGLPVYKQGTSYHIQVVNPTYYASYVEFGHRTPGGKGWVPGQYFLTLSEQDLEKIAPGVLEKKLERLLREAFNV